MSESYNGSPHLGRAQRDHQHGVRLVQITLRGRRVPGADVANAGADAGDAGGKNISCGSSTPQLCFKYTLTDLDDQRSPPVEIFQRLVFNLSWSPEDFKEVQVSTVELVDAGELEFF